MFTSHSPYVLEEFGLNETVVLSRSGDGLLSQASVNLPESVKHKRYRQEFGTRFCEGLLSRRMLLAEGATDATAFPAVARRLKVLALSQTVTAFMHEYLLGIELVVEASRPVVAERAQSLIRLGVTAR